MQIQGIIDNKVTGYPVLKYNNCCKVKAMSNDLNTKKV